MQIPGHACWNRVSPHTAGHGWGRGDQRASPLFYQHWPLQCGRKYRYYYVNLVEAACTSTWECCYYVWIDNIPYSYSPSLPPPSLCVLPLFPSSSALSLLRSASPYPSPSPLLHFPSLLLGEGMIRVSDSSLLDRKVMPVFNLLLSATNRGATPVARTIDIQVVLVM